uniref:PinX1-related protein 1 n=1 Tax=Bionectria ochroleuca TaxID=29856 RepID=A0A8H7N952_BIOOC
MGLLAEAKTRRRINHDPNNTKWTRDETTFGQKILRSQGWQPGEFLGAKDAPHSELHTAASASYIRVSLKDDMKGLGFDKAKDNEISGLDAFTDLLSRLNGKSAASVEEDKQARMVVKLNRYVEQKFGPMRFVRGGLLVGDELKEEEETKESPEEAVSTPVEQKEEAEAPQQKSKKRKASSQSEEDEETSGKDSESKSKKRRRDGEKKSKKKSSDESEANDSSDVARKEKKKSKKDKSRQQSAATSADESESTERASKRKSKTDSSPDDEGDDTKESRQAKKERKEEKRARKELKKLEKKEKKEKKEEKKRRKLEGSDREKSSSATPSGSGTSTPRGNPLMVRSRFLAAKREAMLNDNSINKIFMVKA